ncbi:MAG: transglycosylase SLT domain-containing protein [Candidatus Aenigmatarchaeota archaeon]
MFNDTMRATRLKGDIPGSRMMLIVGVAVIGLLFLTTVINRSMTPSMETSDEARSSYFAHSIASYIGMLSSFDEGLVEKDFDEPVDIAIKRYSLIGTFTYFRPRPAVYYVEVTVYREGGQESKKTFADKGACDAYCVKENCKCQGCTSGMCTIIALKKSVTSDAAPFIGFVDTGTSDEMKLEGVRFVSLRKEVSSKNVKINKAESVSFCTEPSEADVKSVVDSYSAKYGIDKNIIMGVMTQESSFRHCGADGKIKVSSAGAYGIMQLLPSTAGDMVKNYGESLDYNKPVDNIKLGITYLHYLKGILGKYASGEDLDKITVASYNCGIGRLEDLAKSSCAGQTSCWGSVEDAINPDKNKNSVCGSETYNYVKNIFGNFKPCFESNPGCYYSCFKVSCTARSWEATEK